VTAPVGYVRLHGRNYDQWFEPEKSSDRYNYFYKEPELAGWKDKITRMAQKTEVVYVVANNHFQAKAGVNALQLKYMLTGQRVKAPGSLLEHYPELKQIADPLPGETPNSSLPLLA